MHEAILKNRLGDHADAVSDRHQHHHLRLQVRGKSRIGQRFHVDAFDLAALLHANSFAVRAETHPRLFELD